MKKFIQVLLVTAILFNQISFGVLANARYVEGSLFYASSGDEIEVFQLDDQIQLEHEIQLDIMSGESFIVTGNLTNNKMKSDMSPEDFVIDYLTQEKSTFMLDNFGVSTFELISKEDDSQDEQTIVRLQQYFNNIPVYGSDVVACVGYDGTLKSLSGYITPTVLLDDISVQSEILSEEEAIEFAKEYTGEAIFKGEDILYFYKQEGIYIPVYILDSISTKLIINAKTFEVINQISNIQSSSVQVQGKGSKGDTWKINAYKSGEMYQLIDKTRGDGIFTLDVTGNETLEKAFEFIVSKVNELDITTSDIDKIDNAIRKKLIELVYSKKRNVFSDEFDQSFVDIHNYIGKTYDYFYEKYGRNGLNNKGEVPYIATTVSENNAISTSMGNGLLEYSLLIFGTNNRFPYSAFIDVVAHEYVHSLTKNTAKLVYQNESGAINEAYSDIFGTLIEFSYEKDSNWLIGDTLFPLRDMKNPTSLGDPDHYENLYLGNEDYGGVHTNSSIINKLAYLISEGGTHYGIKVEGLGKDRMGQLFYDALTEGLYSQSNFKHLAKVLLAKATTIDEEETIRNGLKSVGIDMDDQVPTNVKEIGRNGEYLKSNYEVNWFKITPDTYKDSYTHLEVRITSNNASKYEVGNITVYSSQDKASKNEYIQKYQSIDGKVIIPIAWDTDYYVRVQVQKDGFKVNVEGILDEKASTDSKIKDLYFNAQNSLNGKSINYEELQSLLLSINESDKLEKVKMALIATGLNGELADLKGQYTSGKDLVYNGDATKEMDSGNGLGTNLSTIIGANGNNGYGITGINQYVQIIPMNIFNSEGRGTTTDLVAAINEAIKQKVKVIHLNVFYMDGIDWYSKYRIDNALDKAKKAGITVIAPSGLDEYGNVIYPGSSDKVIAVSTYDETARDVKALPAEIDLVAPYQNIAVIDKDGEVTLRSDDRFAAAHTSAIVGLMYSVKPNITQDEVLELLTKNAYPVGNQEENGYGLLNAVNTIKATAGVGGYDKPKIRYTDDNQMVVEGRTRAGDTVIIYENGIKSLNDEKRLKVELARVVADADGYYSIVIPKKDLGTTIEVVVKTSNGTIRENTEIIVALEKPTVQDIGDQDFKILGTAQAGMKVVAKVNEVEIGQGIADNNGNYSIEIERQLVGTKVTVVVIDQDGNMSQSVHAIVKDVTPPSVLEVNSITDIDTKITGKSEIGAEVTAKVGSIVIGKSVVDENGNFEIKIEAQSIGTKISLLATDKYNNVSETVEVVVTVSFASFPDVEQGKWYTNHIQEFAGLGYVGGYSDGTFKPHNSITRAEFVKIVNKAFGLVNKFTPVADLPFTDLDSQWKKDELKLALAAGYITPAAEFRHNAPINRQEAAKIVGYLLGDKLQSGLLVDFIDQDEIATWAKDYVAGLVEAGVLTKNETFRPKDPITRAEAVKMLNIARTLN